MGRVLFGVGLLALVGLLACVHSAAPPGSLMRLKAIRAMPLVDRMYAEIDFRGIDDPKTTLREALEALGEEFALRFHVFEKAFAYEMIRDVLTIEIADQVPIPPMKATLAEVLQNILDRIKVPSGACWLMRANTIEITTGQFADPEIKGKSRLEDFEEELGQLVLPWVLVNADFRKTPLAEALALIATRTDKDIVLDESQAKEYGSKPVTARIRNTFPDTAVLLLANQAELGMAKLDNVLYVTTEEKASRLEKRHAQLRPAPVKKAPAKAPVDWTEWLKGHTGSGLPPKK